MSEYPKHIEPHESHFLRRLDGSLYAIDREVFLDRDGRATVIVQDEADEVALTSPKGETK